MATIKFILQSKSNNAPIYARLSIDAKNSFKRKTREFISPEYWNAKKGEPKKIISGTEENLQKITHLSNQLKKLDAFILDEYKNRMDTDIINGDWLTDTIEAFYNGGKRVVELDYLDNYLDYYVREVLEFRRNRGKLITTSTIKKQKSIINKLKEFSKTQKKRLKVKDFGLDMSNKFQSFLAKQGLAKGTIGRYIKYPKTILKHAKILGLEVSDTLSEIQGFTTETPTIYITEKELKQVAETMFLDEKLERAKHWLIIGFYTGQRASDLFKMNKKQIETISGNKCIILKQTKTGTRVFIPVHKEVQKILDKYKGNFPPTYSKNIDSNKTLFNRYLRTICKQSDLIRKEYGKIWNDEEKRYIYGEYPLYEIVSSHICRRSFATHYYMKMPTPVIMSITGHKTEKEFLNYIGKEDQSRTAEILNYWTEAQATTETEPLKQVN